MKLAINQATLMKTPMEQFLKVIGNAGFEGVELRRDETFAYLKDHTVAQLKENLEANKLKMVSWNAIELFSLCPEPEFKKMVDYTEKLMKIGTEIGCQMIIAVPSFLPEKIIGVPEINQKTVERMKILRKIGNNYNFSIGFEPLGPANNSVRKLDHALEVIKQSESDGLRPSGLVVDTFHFFVGDHQAKDLGKVPADKLWLIHLNDIAQTELGKVSDADRMMPGDGKFNLSEFFKQAKKIHYDGYVSIELFNPTYWKMDPQKVANEAARTVKKYL
jgi:sugar phosphate isomerase/epimerase